ncbi:MAG: glycoside hydrolase family 127 protein [Deferribacteres bacterium]|nr:glycoside hydrolase family 127 protein [Deferribacteres bacterium]
MTMVPKRNFFVLILLFFSVNLLAQTKGDYPIHPVPFTEVHMTDNFWLPRIETNRSVTIPHAFKMNEETGRVENFAIAGGLSHKEPQGIYPFDDTDVYKTMEGASYALMVKPDPRLDAYLDSLITLIAAAQEEDGYLYTVRTNKVEKIKRWYGDERWEKLQGSHELYNAGHLFEAAAAHYQATGKRNLLDIALKEADLLVKTFGPENLQKAPGHQVVEMGLAKLYRVTGDEKYIDLAKFFLDVRGRTDLDSTAGSPYNQQHKPVLQQDEAVGHAVRAGYMYSGMADVAALKNDPSYIAAIDRLWQNVAGKKLYLTGGIGSRGSNEGFGPNYDLPNMSAYNETCASIGNVYWNHRQFLLHGESKYIDVMERTLYNALLSGISLEGTRFFYPNALESVGQHERAEWFGCACCPGNMTRFLASLPGYVYAVDKNQIFINLYGSNTAELEAEAGTVTLIQKSNYPWDGAIDVIVKPQKKNLPLNIKLRIPGWAQGKPVATDLYRYLNDEPGKISIAVNGKKFPVKMKNGYAEIERAWQDGDKIELQLPMIIRRVIAIDSVKADIGRVALERGPLVFCAEWPDNPDGHVRNLLLPDAVKLTTKFDKDLLHGVQVIQGEAVAYHVNEAGNRVRSPQTFTAIPYYSWANRGKGEMVVWFAREESAVTPLGLPTLASQSKVSASSGRNPDAVNDQLEPASSNDHEIPYFHWWPNKGTTEWIQYDFAAPTEVSIAQVYWFDDTGQGECRIPKSWRIMYFEDGEWKKAYAPEGYPIAKDEYNEAVFETVRTKSLRLEVEAQEGWAGGVYELKIK